MDPDNIPQFNDDDSTQEIPGEDIPEEDLPLEELLKRLANKRSAEQIKESLGSAIENEPDTSEIDASNEAIESVLADIASETKATPAVRPPTPAAQPTPAAPKAEQFPKSLSALLDAQLAAEEQLTSDPQEGLREEDTVRAEVKQETNNGNPALIIVGVLGLLLLIGGLAALAAFLVGGLFGPNEQPSVAEATGVVEATALPTETTTSDVVTPSEKPEDSEPTLVPTQPPSGQPLPGDKVDQNGALMVYVPTSTFDMGSEQTPAERPIHTISLNAYFIDVFEVTNRQWATCVEEGICDLPGSTLGYDDQPYYGVPAFDNYPVAYVNWEAAQEFCAWRGTRLPTEAEWELAARYDPEDESLSNYPWGDRPQRGNLNFCDASCLLEEQSLRDQEFDDGYPQMAPVGQFERDVSALGVLDMGGNMVEWVNDWFSADYYAQSPAENPTGPAEGTARTVRGGGWSLPVEFARTTRRAGFGPDTQAAGIGFRCAVGAGSLN